MGTKIDITGKKFNLLTVLSETEKRISGSPVWECKCDCGNITYVCSKDLQRGTTKSCGCYKKESRILDLSGKKFNNLTAIDRDEDTGLWNCICDCGNKTTAKTVELTKNHKKSCGCLIKLNLIGEKFGLLSVISEYVGKARGKNRKWNCLCDCGNECKVTTNNLRNGGTRSCGCLRKETSRKQGKSQKIYHKYGTPFRHLIGNYKKRAISKNMDFSLTDDEFYLLTKGLCFYCNSSPSKTMNYRGEEYIFNGVDRLNSSLGYTKDNSVSCCYICNYAKRDMKLEDFLEWIEKLKNG